MMGVWSDCALHDMVQHGAVLLAVWQKYEMRHSRDEKNRKRVGYFKCDPPLRPATC